jgi:hypothetical protein
MKLPEKVIRKHFEKYCKEGTRPYLYTLDILPCGEYVSHFTEDAWKIYLRGWNDYAAALVFKGK